MAVAEPRGRRGPFREPCGLLGVRGGASYHRLMARILLVRHGESEWNALGRWQGQADSPLSDLGRLQAKVASRALGQVDAIASSDLQRAQVTAEIISGELGVGPVIVDADLRERDAGEWSGLTRADIHRDWPGFLHDDPVRRDGSTDHQDQRPPGWETDEHLRDRALVALGRLAAVVGDGEAVAITHGGLVYAIEEHLGAGWERLPNLGGRWVELTDDRLRLGERVILVDPHDVAMTIPDQI
jgi:broad specificity phosphatase PhoE